jgi:hypothetical protein
MGEFPVYQVKAGKLNVISLCQYLPVFVCEKQEDPPLYAHWNDELCWRRRRLFLFIEASLFLFIEASLCSAIRSSMAVRSDRLPGSPARSAKGLPACRSRLRSRSTGRQPMHS